MRDGSTLVLILCAAGIIAAAWGSVAAARRARWEQTGLDRPLHIRIDR